MRPHVVINITMKYPPLATLTFISIFLAVGEMYAQSNTALDDVESVTVYPSIEVVVNKTIVVRLPQKGDQSSCNAVQQLAEVVVVAPDQLLINGNAVGATIVLWFGTNRNPVNNRTFARIQPLPSVAQLVGCRRPRKAIHTGA